MAQPTNARKVADPVDANALLRMRADLLSRFADIRSYFQAREIHSYMAVFVAVDESLANHAADIRQWWGREGASLKADDAPIIERMERVIDHLKAA